jgi:lysophospholipase L1-like esterase
MKIKLLLFSLCTLPLMAQQTSFDFNFTGKKGPGTLVTAKDIFTSEEGYGYDLQPVPSEKSKTPWFFSVKVPDGNYRVTVTLGGRSRAGVTTVRAESRRLFLENVATRKGELRTFTFVVNKRNPQIDGRERVKIKVREQSKLNWDDKLTLEFNGDAPVCSEVKIEKADDVPTIFLAGNSTVVDQDNEPWASWGQMIPRWFGDGICFANYAESGESANTFIAAGRLKKALTQMKAGDYMLIEFGHNDQKQHGPGKGAYYSFATSLKTFIDEVKAKGATPILVTPTQRRSFQNGKIMETHGDYPEAMRWVAQREGVALIDLHELTRTLFETFGEEGSLHAFVHYPAGTYPHQTVALADNTHFNPYGAYEIAKCVIEGMKANHLDGITKFLRPDYKPFSPSRPDNLKAFHWNDSPFTEVEKPDGN